MAYNILNTDGTTLTLLADGTVDQSTTSISSNTELDRRKRSKRLKELFYYSG